MCVCVCLCVYVCVYTYLQQPASYLLWRGYSFIKIFLLIWICFQLVSNSLTGQRHWWQFLSASLISSWIFFFFFQTTVWNNYWNIVHNKLEVCCSLPRIYNWLYTIVLTFQTALSTFILMTHLCIDFSFKNACCERHRYPVCLMWKENVFCFVKELSSIVVNTWTEVAEL